VMITFKAMINLSTMNSFFETWMNNPKNPETISKIRAKHKGSLPVIIQPSTDLEPKIIKYKFIINKDATLSQLMFVVRKYINLGADEGLFFYILSFDQITCQYVRKVFEPLSKTMGQLEASHSCDGFLYIVYALESVFGG
jgi:GABA(A) receptor-associated protein